MSDTERLQVTTAETELVKTLNDTWEELVLKSKNIDASLITVKKKFTEVCREEGREWDEGKGVGITGKGIQDEERE